MSDIVTHTITTSPTGRHPVNIGHLVMGLAFLGLVGVWALIQTEVVDGDEIRWLLPVPFVLAGVAGLVATAVTGTRRYGVRQTGWVDNRADPAADEDIDADIDEGLDAEIDTDTDETEENR